jgi:hypothetical protein
MPLDIGGLHVLVRDMHYVVDGEPDEKVGGQGFRDAKLPPDELYDAEYTRDHTYYDTNRVKGNEDVPRG